MTNNAAKIVENYVIHNKLFTHLDKSDFFSAQHRILKKIFTLRKVKLSSHLEGSSSKGALKAGPEQLQQRVNHEVDLLRQLNGVGTPKCHKVIKTANNIYIVYDQFPSRNLKQYLLKNIMTKAEKLELMLKIACTLKLIHTAGIILNGLTVQTIRVHDNGDILICDFSLSCMADKPEKLNRELLSLHEKENFPEEIVNKGKCSYSTDVFMLGGVFGQIIANQLDNHHPKYRVIRKIIENMIKPKPSDRISLGESIMEIEIQQNKTIVERKGNLIGSPVALLAPPALFNDLKPRKYSMDESNKERDISVVPKQGAIIKKMTCEDLPNADFSLRQKKNYSIASGSTKPLTIITSVKNLQLKCPSTASNRSRSMRSLNCDPKDIQISRKVNKERNLAFFISGLAQFVIELQSSPELAFLLIKYANLTLKDCLQHFPSEDGLSQEVKHLQTIIMGQKQKIHAMQSKMRDMLIPEANESSLKRQLQQNSSISDRYLQRKILQFSRWIQSQLQRPSEGRRSVAESTSILFNVYMLLKKVEMGSYQKFWESIYNSNYANLCSQRYMKDQKNLGFRYLRSKVSSIMS